MTRRELRRRERLQDRAGYALIISYVTIATGIGAAMIDWGWGLL